MKTDASRYIHLTEGRRPVEDGQDRMYYCELSRYYSENVFRNFSIKFTLEGTVQYRTENELYELLPNYFLLSSRQPCECVVDSRTITRNISIDISEATMNEVFTTLTPGKEADLDNLEAGHFTSPGFFEYLYPVGNSELGQYLLQLGGTLTATQKTNNPLSEEIFFALAERVIAHEKGIQFSLQQLEAVKSSTKKETLKRLLSGKKYIDENYLSDITIPHIARHAHLSQYYFLRTFKSAFQFSPHQYLLDRRLNHARQLLQKKEKIQEVADKCGFPDSPSFSKAFKKKFGISPSRIEMKP